MKIFTFFVLLLLAFELLAGASHEASFTLPSGVAIKIVEAPFRGDLFKISGCNENKGFCRINGRTPYGTSFELPKTYVKGIYATYRGRSYSLDTSDMYDAWGKRPLEVRGVIRYFGGSCFDVANCQFRGIFSDGAGSFVAEWRVVGGRAHRTVLTDSGDIMDLFMKNIDPPVFE